MDKLEAFLGKYTSRAKTGAPPWWLGTSQHQAEANCLLAADPDDELREADVVPIESQYETLTDGGWKMVFHTCKLQLLRSMWNFEAALWSPATKQFDFNPFTVDLCWLMLIHFSSGFHSNDLTQYA